ncbi:heterokaryon incompatibility protein-domain-containing protein [Tricladium varicosporioides]|nr:heterokaryon incompatibility protein-domain-containing protein [Hymenoscyphus varicosporioides]
MPYHPETQGATTNCYKDCPICWSITERNIQRMRAGESIILGTWPRFLSFAIPGRDEVTGIEQGACPLCANLATHIVKVEGNKTYGDAAILSISIDHEEESEKTPIFLQSKKYLKRLTIKISQKQDLWKDDSYRAKHLGSHPKLLEGVTSWENERTYTFHMAFCTNGGPTEHYVQQRMASPEVVTEEIFNEIRRWTNECLIEHDECPKMAFKQLPSRVLDLSNSNGNFIDTISLMETGGATGSSRAVYAALSYCWGHRPQEILLTEETLNTFTAGIAVRDLPASLRHAILVTRGLGLQYLWIDALCIIQDSDEDKAKELSQMPHIYKNAIVTISAAIVDNCYEGFLHERPEIINRIEASFCLPLVWDVLQPDGERASKIWLSPDDSRGFNIKQFEDEVIESRAWTFQEAWLSPRLLIYGSGPVQWRCLSKVYTQGLDEEQVKPEKFDLMKRITAPQYQERKKFFSDSINALATQVNEGMKILAHDTSFPPWLENWLIIASHYSKRQISFKSDRLPALSAIASEFGRMYSDQYLAGLWKRSLPWALLWHCCPQKPIEGPINVFRHLTEEARKQDRIRNNNQLAHLTMPQIYDLGTKYNRAISMEHFQKGPSNIKASKTPAISLVAASSASQVEKYIAPSWSFASVNTGVIFTSHEWDGPHHTLLSIHAASTTPRYPNVSYGEVTEGSITLTGPMQSLSIDEIIAFFVVVDPEIRPHIYWDYIIPDDSSLGNEIFGPLIETQKDEDMVNFNPQLGITERITRKMLREGEILPEVENQNDRPAPPEGHFVSFEQINREQELYFLEVTWTQTPRGLVLVRNGKDKDGVEVFERVGYFLMGRENYEKSDWRIRGEQDAGGRDWDWYSGLKMYTIKIV